MKKLSLFTLIALVVLLIACSKNSPNETIITPPKAKVTYNGNIKTLFSGNCLGCHGATPSNGAPTSYDTYSKAKAAIDKIITRTNSASSPMPTGGLMSTTNRDLIKKWKTDGLLEK